MKKVEIPIIDNKKIYSNNDIDALINETKYYLDKDKKLRQYRLSPDSIQNFRSKIKKVSKEKSLQLGKDLFDIINDKKYDENKALNKVIDLILTGAKLDYYDNFNESFPLLICAQRNYLWTFIALVRGGADINKSNCRLSTPTILSAAFGNDLILEILILLGANINAVNKFGETALMLAKINEQYKCFDMLVASGARTDIGDNQVLNDAIMGEISKYKNNSSVTYEDTQDLIKEAEQKLRETMDTEHTLIRKKSNFKRIN